MLINIPAIIKLICIGVVVSLPRVQNNACDSGWFGNKCRFQCHCLVSKTCEANGTCPDNNQCAAGYFGPACQYVDLTTRARTDNDLFAIDGNEDTCNTNSSDRDVRVSLISGITFTWLRLHVKKSAHLNSFNVKLNEKIACPNERKFAVSETSVDVTCDANFSVLAVEVIGAVAPDVCSIYISGGRNVALRQSANQTTTYRNDTKSKASNAVDGNTDSNYDHGSCMHTTHDGVPTWRLYFDRPYSLYEIIIYNRDFHTDHLSGTVVTAYNERGVVTFSYTMQSDGSLQMSITQVRQHDPVTMISIVKPTELTVGRTFVALCEVQTFGEVACPDGYYGILCDKRCACKDTEVCFTVTGACSPGCPIGQYGPNCALTCNLKCRHLECRYREGTCLSCHEGYFGKYCAEDCKIGTYGPSCAMNCSKNCDGICDRRDGFCLCRHPFVGTECSECPASFYGENCTKMCPSNCAFSKCNFNTGECVSCLGAHRGQNCKECPRGYYGSLCLKACSKFCYNETCHLTTGACSPCTNSYTGRNCSEVPVTMPWLYLITVVSVSTLLFFLFIWVYIRRAAKRNNDDAVSDDSGASS